MERNLSEEERSFDIVLKYPGADNACLKVVQGTDSEYMIIAETKWAKQNCGIDESNPYGKLYNYDEALTACPDGWRAPTRAEMSRLCTRYSDFEEVDGIRGRWFSGEETYSTQATRIFLPAEDTGKALTERSWNFLRVAITSAEKRTRRVMCMSYIFSTSNSPALSPHSTIRSFMGPCVA